MLSVNYFAYDEVLQTSSFFYFFRAKISFIIATKMQVYIELALLENFCMDFSLLVCAKLITKNIARYYRVFLGALVGAIFAVLFPLISFNQAVVLILKICAGIVICLIGARFIKVKAFIKFACVFFALTFLLGGALTAIFSYFNLNYANGAGFLISSIPVGIPLFCIVLLMLGCKRLANKIISKNSKISVKCHIVRGQSSVLVSGFYDSGNKVYFKGSPVSVIDLSVAEKIIDINGIFDFVLIHTVAGSKKIKIFTADEIILYTGEKTHKIKNVTFGISPNKISCAVLHPDLSEAI